MFLKTWSERVNITVTLGESFLMVRVTKLKTLQISNKTKIFGLVPSDATRWYGYHSVTQV
jgi:hypothetical protein